MNRITWKRTLLAAMSLVVSVALVGCEEKGPMQKAGEGVDNAGKDLRNAVDQRGPAEKIGDKVDNAVGK